MRAESGFTLIEILVVVIIIAGLVTLVGPRILDRLGESREKQTIIEIANLESAVKLFKVDNGFYPETQQGLLALIEIPSAGREPKNYAKNGYLESTRIPVDPWGNEFIYVGPDQTGDGIYEIRSPGEDGILNTDDDISSRDMK